MVQWLMLSACHAEYFLLSLSLLIYALAVNFSINYQFICVFREEKGNKAGAISLNSFAAREGLLHTLMN